MDQRVLLNRYKVVEKLGQGGMGTIWKVLDEIENREVALKEIKIEQPSTNMHRGSYLSLTSTVTQITEAELRFSEEFRTMNKLQYPYTVKVFDYGILENFNKYITMEIVEGENLREILNNRQLEFSEINKIFIQLAQTLSFIHSRLYVHRDIKPENLIITKDGNIKLMDFGLMDRIGVPSEGKLSGTINYLPPEVAKGGIVDERSDLYSLGCLAYELVTGKPPFEGDKVVEVVKMHLNQPPQELNEIRQDTPEALKNIILKLLAKEQKDRYQNCTELIRDLQKICGEDVTVETLEQRKSYLHSSEIIGRDENLAGLSKTFNEMMGQKGRSIFLGAPAGVGKTRTVQEFKVEAQLAGVLFLEGFCLDQGMSTYQPFKEVLKPTLSLLKKDVLDEFGSVLVKIIPELQSKGYEPLEALEEFGEKARICEAVTQWLSKVSQEKPIVICFEDLHWSDASTIDLFNACVRNLRNSRIMFLGTFRLDEVDETSPLLFTIEENLTELMKLSHLDQNNTQMLIHTMLGEIDLSEQFMESVYSVTGGNPFFVTETLRSLIEQESLVTDFGRWKVSEKFEEIEIPNTIGEAISRRLSLLSEKALETIKISTVFGRDLDLVLQRKLINYEDEKFFTILDELIERQFLKKESGVYSFIHDRVRETLYESIDESTRKTLHEQIANFIEESNQSDLDKVSASLAYHYSRSDNHSKAVDYLMKAASTSFSKGAYTEAIDLFQRTLEILKFIDYPNKEQVAFEARLKVLHCNSYAVKPLFCMECCEELLKTLYARAFGQSTLINIVKVFRVSMKMIDLLPHKLAHKIKAMFLMDFPVYVLPKKGDIFNILNKIIEICFMYQGSYMFLGDYNKMQEYIKFIEDKILPSGRGSVPDACIAAARGSANLVIGRDGEGEKDAKLAVEVFKEFESNLNRLQLFLFAATSFWVNNSRATSGQKTLLKEYRDICMRLSDENSFVDWLGWQALTDFVFALVRGDQEKAQIGFNNVSDCSKKMGRPFGLESWIYCWNSYYLFNKGDYDGALKSAEKVERVEIADWNCQLGMSRIVKTMVKIYQNQERVNEILPEVEEILSKNREFNYMTLSVSLTEAAKVYLMLDRIDDAEKALSEALSKASQEDFYNPFHLILIYRGIGDLAVVKKDYESAEKNLTEALRLAAETDNTIQKGLTLQSLGKYYIEIMKNTKAHECLDKAIGEFEKIHNQWEIERSEKIKNQMNESQQD